MTLLDKLKALVEAGNLYFPHIEMHDGVIIQRDKTGGDDWYPNQKQQEFFCKASNARAALKEIADILDDVGNLSFSIEVCQTDGLCPEGSELHDLLKASQAIQKIKGV